MSPAAIPSVLLVEDSLSLARVYTEYLKAEPWAVQHVDTGRRALAAIDDAPPQAMLLDLKLPDMDGMEILRHVQANDLPVAVVVITAHGSINVAVDAMRYGAFDFLVKPFNADRLIVTVRNALERQRLARIVETYEENIARPGYCGFIGSSLSMQAVYRMIEGAAPSKATVFITGESGTGKELCAEAIHQQSPRGDRPYVAINCAAIPRDLIESEIFGHVKGAFTGAIDDREGAAARADGGTLFLDEICEMDINLQTKLLRFIQTGTYQKVGSSRLEKVDVRFVCATNQDPLKAVEEGRFREDLYYRLHVIPIHMPPLRERDQDVIEVARNLLAIYAREENKHFAGFANETEALLAAYDWPGNVRQLQNVLRNVVVLNDGDTVTPEMLPPPLSDGARGAVDAAAAASRLDGAGGAVAVVGGGAAPEAAVLDPPRAHDTRAVRPLWQVEREAIEQAIVACGGNIPKAAAMLEISASTIYRKRQTWAEREPD